MFPRSWISPRSNEAELASEPPKQSSLPAYSHEEPAMSSAAGRHPVERAITAALSTPHDAVLAEIHGHTPRLDASKPAADTSQGAADQGPEGSVQATSLSTGAAPEPVYDPFSGGLAYILPPRSPSEQGAESVAPNFQQSKDELWSQLGRIRELQSEIAVMHVQMEGVGNGDGRVPKKVHTRTPTDNIMGEDWPDPGQEEEDKKRARDAEFANLAQAFEGRHTSVDTIMKKVYISSGICYLVTDYLHLAAG